MKTIAHTEGIYEKTLVENLNEDIKHAAIIDGKNETDCSYDTFKAVGNALTDMFNGKDISLSIEDGEYHYGEIIIDLKDGRLVMWEPMLITNMLSMDTEKNYYFYLYEGDYGVNHLYIDLQQVEIKQTAESVVSEHRNHCKELSESTEYPVTDERDKEDNDYYRNLYEKLHGRDESKQGKI